MKDTQSSPLIDRRLMRGMAVVVAAQWSVWLAIGVIGFGTGGTTPDFFIVTILGLVLSIPIMVAAFLIGLGPVLAAWVGAMALGKALGMSERFSAILAGPLVVLIVCAMLFVAMAHDDLPNLKANWEVFGQLLLFSSPGMVAAGIYAHLAWPNVRGQKGIGS
jgi:hypothetical protein